MNELHHRQCKLGDLTKIDETIWCYVLASGGPLMRVVCIEGDRALCEFHDSQDRNRRLYTPVACLRRLVPVTPAELK